MRLARPIYHPLLLEGCRDCLSWFVSIILHEDSQDGAPSKPEYWHALVKIEVWASTTIPLQLPRLSFSAVGNFLYELIFEPYSYGPRELEIEFWDSKGLGGGLRLSFMN